MSDERVAVVGAGLVGSLWALMLARLGYVVDVYDRRSDPRTAGNVGGRSINLALSERGWKALDLAGIQDEVRAIAMPIKGRRMHAVDGSLTFQPYGRAEGGRRRGAGAGRAGAAGDLQPQSLWWVPAAAVS